MKMTTNTLRCAQLSNELMALRAELDAIHVNIDSSTETFELVEVIQNDIAWTQSVLEQIGGTHGLD